MNNMQNLGLLTLRAGVGGVLLAHGVQKLFGWLGGAGLTGTPQPCVRADGIPARPAERRRSGGG